MRSRHGTVGNCADGRGPVERHVIHRTHLDGPGVVDYDVDAAEPLDHECHRALDIVALANVSLHSDDIDARNPVTNVCWSLLQLPLVAREQDEPCAIACGLP